MLTKCPNNQCGAEYRLRPEQIGKTVRCAKCRTVFQIHDYNGSESINNGSPGVIPSDTPKNGGNPVPNSVVRFEKYKKGRAAAGNTNGAGPTANGRSNSGRSTNGQVEGALAKQAQHEHEDVPLAEEAGPEIDIHKTAGTAALSLSIRCANCNSIFRLEEVIKGSVDELEDGSEPLKAGPKNLTQKLRPYFLSGALAILALVIVTALFWNHTSIINQRVTELEKEKDQLIKTIARNQALDKEKETKKPLPQIQPPYASPPEQEPEPEPIENMVDYSFRRTRWGMSMQAVQASESGRPNLKEGNTLGYRGVVLGKDVYIFYVFARDRLVRARYVLAERYSHPNDYITDYNAFKKALTDKYGKPAADDVTWKDKRHMNDRNKWGLALSLGAVNYQAAWETGSTRIECSLNGGKNAVDCVLEYTGLNWKHLEEQETDGTWEAL